MSFNEQYQKILNIVKDDIEQINKRLILHIDINEPIKTNLLNFLTAPSKRIRSLLAILYLKANNISIKEKHYDFLTAIELIHNASLIHDDIIDESSTRRLQKTLNTELGNKLAVISGDYLLSLAMAEIGKLNSFELIEILSKTLENMCKGEVFQQINKFKIPSLEEYLLKSEQKTASLFQSTLTGSILINDCNTIKNTSEFGLNFGLAFQIRDDLKNVISYCETKSINSDISDGIYNAPVIFAGNIYDLKAGIEKTYGLLNNYIDKSLELIKDSLEENQYTRTIMELLELIRDE